MSLHPFIRLKQRFRFTSTVDAEKEEEGRGIVLLGGYSSFLRDHNF